MMRLRQNLELYPAAKTELGAQSWTLHDPVRECFFRLGWREVEMLREISRNAIYLSAPKQLAEHLKTTFSVNIESEETSDFIEFLQHNLLVTGNHDKQRDRLSRHYASSPRQQGINLSALSKSYLFFKIPLVKPDALLTRLLPLFSWLFNRTTLWVLVAVSIVGVFLTSRQWHVFSSAISGVLTPRGMLLFFIALSVVKILHELGHALAAKKMGCRVPVMGIAFMVFWPILYTDTTDAWRLSSRRQKLWINGAGIVVELSIAALCLLLWHLVPDGLLKGTLFLLATTTWVMTLLVNLNPLMRFDGYFLLADYMKIDNLQGRSFALTRWWLRRCIFGIEESAPERMRAFLIVYAFAAWAYRLFLFVSIAWLIYTFFFKALGIALVVYYLFASLLKPIGLELLNCLSQRNTMRIWPNTIVSLTVISLFLILLLYPFDRNMSVPGYVTAQNHIKLYAPVAGQLLPYQTDHSTESQRVTVAKNQVIFEFSTPDLDHQLALAEYEKQQLLWQLQYHSVNSDSGLSRPRLQQELLTVSDKVLKLQSQLSSNTLVAPVSGQLVDVPLYLKPGVWVAKGAPLGAIVGNGDTVAVAYVTETQAAALAEGQQGYFYPDNSTQRIPITLGNIDAFALEQMDEPYHAATYGGEIDVVQAPQSGALQPVKALYRAHFSVVLPIPERVLRGTVQLTAPQGSLWSGIYRRVMGVWRRESGF